MFSNLDKLSRRSPVFVDPDRAREHIEAVRWNGEPRCPHCGSLDARRLERKAGSKVRKGVYKCRVKGCRKQFTVTVGTLFASSHIGLNKWLWAVHRLCTSRNAVSATQLRGELGVTHKSALLMCRRIDQAIEASPLSGRLSASSNLHTCCLAVLPAKAD